MEIYHFILLICLFFGVAVLYAAAGFGGGSSYLAILSFFPLHFHMMRTTALVCNLVVVSGSLWQFYQHQKLNKQVLTLAISFTVLSIPASFMMSSLGIEKKVFLLILGIALFFSSLSMWVTSQSKEEKIDYERRNLPWANLFTGGILGALAGLVGIGGGIFLSPWMHMRKLALPQVITIVSTIFIFVNSTAALSGQLFAHDLEIIPILLIVLALAVFIGGSIGVRINIKRLNQLKIRRITSVVVCLASINVLIKSFML